MNFGDYLLMTFGCVGILSVIFGGYILIFEVIFGKED